MSKFGPTEAAPAPEAEGLSSALACLANGLGVCLDELSVPDGSEADRVLLEIKETTEHLRSSYQIVDSLQAARGNAELTREEGFASGTIHAVGEILDSYRARIEEQPSLSLDETESQRSERVCADMGENLADLQFTAGWRLLLTVKGSAAQEVGVGAKGYVDGMEYALKRALTSFRARVEDRATRVLSSDVETDETRTLATLLFIAVTEASSSRVRGVFGEGIAATLEALDEARLIKCTQEREMPPLRVTPRGAAAAYELSRQFEAVPAA